MRQKFSKYLSKSDWLITENGWSPEDLRARYDQLAEQELRKRQARDEFDRHLADIGEKVRKLREQDHKLTRLVEERRAALQSGQGKYASLEALQQAALGAGDDHRHDAGGRDYHRGCRCSGHR